MTEKSFFEAISLSDIEEFIENKTPEDLYLEFKTANFPKELTFDYKNFSKCLSGFSNSLGGILIWGIKACKNKDGVDAANELKPIKDLLKFENHLKRIEGNCVVPIIDGIEYRRIEKTKDEGYLLVYVPSSERAPHMAQLADKHYYKRSGDSFYICEHFDIMDMLNRKITPKLQVEILNENITKKLRDGHELYKYHSIFTITNIGQVTAKYIVVFIRVIMPFKIADYGIDGNGNRGMKRIPTRDSFTKYIGGTDLVLHPETSHEVDKIVLNEIGIDDNISDLIIEYKIIAEGMKLMTGEIIKSKEKLLKQTNA
jgi:hypothetical protein